MWDGSGENPHTLSLSLFFMFFILRERETTHTSREGAERGERESQAGSMLSTEPDAGLDPMTIRSRPKLKSSWTPNQLSHPGAPG